MLGVEPAFCVAVTLMYLEFLKDREVICLRCFVIPVRGSALRPLGECSARLRVFDERVLSNWRDNGYGTCAFLRVPDRGALANGPMSFSTSDTCGRLVLITTFRHCRRRALTNFTRDEYSLLVEELKRGDSLCKKGEG